jgi:hypothetical protein
MTESLRVQRAVTMVRREGVPAVSTRGEAATSVVAWQLSGKAPDPFPIEATRLKQAVPVLPAAVPSSPLERRPGIATARPAS